jgi:hypothetical protein
MARSNRNTYPSFQSLVRQGCLFKELMLKHDNTMGLNERTKIVNQDVIYPPHIEDTVQCVRDE